MCCLETIESVLLRFSDRNTPWVPATVHSWNHSWNTDHYASLFAFCLPLSPSSAPTPPPSFFPTGLWAPHAALLVPSSPPPWRGGGHWSGAWVGATIPRRRHWSRTAGISTRCPWWCDTSWSPATSVWSCWPHPLWASPCSCSSTTVRWYNRNSQLFCLLCTRLYCLSLPGTYVRFTVRYLNTQRKLHFKLYSTVRFWSKILAGKELFSLTHSACPCWNKPTPSPQPGSHYLSWQPYLHLK